MFDQLVSTLRMIDVLNSLFTSLEVIGWLGFAIAILFWIFVGADNGFDESKKFLWITLPLLIFSLIISFVLHPLFAPPKEYVVLKAIAPKIDKYVEEHPDTLLKIENLTGIVDDTAKSILSLVKKGSDSITSILEDKVGIKDKKN